MNYTRDRNLFTVTLTSEYAAQKFELLLQNYEEATPSQSKTDLGDRTAYNAERQLLKDEYDRIQEQINAIDTAIDPDARAKLDRLIPLRDAVHRRLKAQEQEDQ